MFVSSNLIYLQMHKTGCSHITRVLSQYENGVVAKKHAFLTFDPEDRWVISSVRNPWEWYLSLWAFGCSGRGAFYLKMARPFTLGQAWENLRTGRPRALFRDTLKAFKRNDWKALYGNPHDKELFRNWIKMVLSEEGKNNLIEGYPESGVKRCAGFMTYRLLRLCTKHDLWGRHGVYLDKYQDVHDFWNEHSTVDFFIRNESLDGDLAHVLRKLGHQVTEEPSNVNERTNKSEHGPLHSYYDEETIALVANNERLLIDTFGYRCPQLHG